MTDLFLAWIGILTEHGMYRHDNTRGTKAALQAMLVQERVVEGMQMAIVSSHPLNGRHRHPICLYCKHQTGAYGLSIQQHSAATTNTMFAANMRTCKVEVMTEKIRKKQTHRHASFVVMTINCHCNITHLSEGRYLLFLLLHRPCSSFFASVFAAARRLATRAGSIPQ